MKKSSPPFNHQPINQRLVELLVAAHVSRGTIMLGRISLMEPIFATHVRAAENNEKLATLF